MEEAPLLAEIPRLRPEPPAQVGHASRGARRLPHAGPAALLEVITSAETEFSYRKPPAPKD